MKILNIKYIISISFIILVVILYLTLLNIETKDEVPERAILAFEGVGGKDCGKG